MSGKASTGAGVLVFAASLSALAALAHVAIVFGGPTWYRFFGAGEGMVLMAARGDWYPAMVTLAIASILAVWSAYALSGAGVIRRLPLVRIVLVAVTAVYLVRGVAGMFVASAAPDGNSPSFWFWSSIICLSFGVVHALGLARRWTVLSDRHPQEAAMDEESAAHPYAPASPGRGAST